MSREPKDRTYFDEYENLGFHPYNILLALLLFGISAMFLALTISFVYTRVQSHVPPTRIPWIFLFNTLVLLGSSYTIHKATRAYKQDKTRAYQQFLLLTILLSFSFLGLQFIGWGELFRNNLFLGKDNSVSYLYLISGLHFAHLIAGLPFLVLFYRTALQKMKEPVSVLVYFSDPAKRLKLRLLRIYWHFLDALWIYLVLFFFINYWVNG